MDTLIAIGEAIVDFVVGVVGSCSGHDFKRRGKGKKKGDKPNN